MTGITDDMIKRAAEEMRSQYDSEHDAGHLSWQDFTGDARKVVEAALAGRVVVDIPEPNAPGRDQAVPAGGLAAYVNRVRAGHRRLSNGWCSCETPCCPQRYLLDHIEDLLMAYQLKVQDLAKETARVSELSAEVSGGVGGDTR